MQIGQRIRDVRKAAGLTQEALARRADISLNVLNRIERGAVTDPHYSTLNKLADGLGVSVGELIGERHAVGKDLTIRWKVEEAAKEAASEIVDLALESAARGQDITTIKTAAARRLEEHLVAS
jgi:transcriptional regulator with XRE-family HTH domain